MKDSGIIGHDGFRYKPFAGWGALPAEKFPVKDCHGIAVDTRNDRNLTLLITSGNQNAWKRFTTDGVYISTIYLPGSFVCRPVIHDKNIYGAVFRSGTNQNPESGFISILDENDKLVLTPGGAAPLYRAGALQEQKQDGKIFMHPHDVCVDDEANMYIPQWNSHNTYPIKLERIH